jgi:hypothetical protein
MVAFLGKYQQVKRLTGTRTKEASKAPDKGACNQMLCRHEQRGIRGKKRRNLWQNEMRQAHGRIGGDFCCKKVLA